MKDIQNTIPNHNFPIHRVGITGLKLPIYILEKTGKVQHSVADINCFVDLDSDLRGTHMSRITIGIQKFINQQLRKSLMEDIVDYIKSNCEAKACQLIYTFPYFVQKLAPVSKEPGLIHYNTTFDLTKDNGNTVFIISVESTATSLCPCSKEISDVGAHNQRSKIKIICESKPDEWVWIEDLIESAEKSSSCQIYSSLKRTDERFVTEHAYNNPKFVEDTVRELYNNLKENQNIKWFKIIVENEESIHTHNAYAMIDSRLIDMEIAFKKIMRTNNIELEEVPLKKKES